MSLGFNDKCFCLSLPGSLACVAIQNQPDTQNNASGELVSASKAKGIATLPQCIDQFLVSKASDKVTSLITT